MILFAPRRAAGKCDDLLRPPDAAQVAAQVDQAQPRIAALQAASGGRRA
jgi:hypothetical protein